MKRFFVKLVLFLLLGAIVNVAVAWGMDIARQRNQSAVAAPVALQILSISAQWRLAPRHLAGWHESGWPCEALVRGDRDINTDTTGCHGWRDGMSLKLRTGSPFHQDLIRVALLPTLTGFGINTIFYAAILWMLVATPRQVRRWLRIKRGLCGACGYPVGESETCTECGKPVQPRSVEPGA